MAVIPTVAVGWGPAPRYGRSELPPPYTEAEIEGLLRLAAAQSTTLKRDRLHSLIYLAAGAPLREGEVSAVRGEDVFRYRKTTIIRVKGRYGRIVPLDYPFGSRLEEIAERYEGKYLLGPRNDAVHRLIRSLSLDPYLPPISVGRLRATYLTRLLSDTGFDAIVAALGVRHTRIVFDAVAYLPKPDLDRIIEVLGWF